MNLLYDNTLHHKVTVTNTSSVVLPADTSRGFLLIQNISDTDVFIAFGEAAQLDYGILVVAKGNLLLDVATFSAAISAIHGGTGSKTLLITVAA